MSSLHRLPCHLPRGGIFSTFLHLAFLRKVLRPEPCGRIFNEILGPGVGLSFCVGFHGSYCSNVEQVGLTAGLFFLFLLFVRVPLQRKPMRERKLVLYKQQSVICVAIHRVRLIRMENPWSEVGFLVFLRKCFNLRSFDLGPGPSIQSPSPYVSQHRSQTSIVVRRNILSLIGINLIGTERRAQVRPTSSIFEDMDRTSGQTQVKQSLLLIIIQLAVHL